MALAVLKLNCLLYTGGCFIQCVLWTGATVTLPFLEWNVTVQNTIHTHHTEWTLSKLLRILQRSGQL